MQKGDIYSCYNKGKKKYTALQLVDIIQEKNQYVFLALYYWEDEPLTPEKLNDIKPFWRDHHNWKGEHDFLLFNEKIPDSFTLVGNREILVAPDEDKVKGSSGWSFICIHQSLQKAWNELPQEFRDSYKKAGNQRSHLLADDVAKIVDPFELSKYPQLTKLEVNGECSWLMDYINTHHNITELTWENSPEANIDLSKSRIMCFKTDGKRIEQLILNDYFNELYFFNDIPSGLNVQAAPMNRSFDLHARNTNNLQVFRAINITELCIVGDGKEPINIAAVAAHLPQLRTLRIWGHPDNVENMNSISLLKSLSWLTLNDIFGFSAKDFPSPNSLSSVSCIWMSSIPEDVAKKVKKEYKHIDLWIRKGRKPEWLEANLNNPFRHWDGDEYIAAAHTKKASTLYAKYYKQIGDFLKAKLDPKALQQELENIIKEYAKEFNKMDERKHWIDTVTREDIYGALNLLLKPTIEAHGDEININALFDLFDNLRDF